MFFDKKVKTLGLLCIVLATFAFAACTSNNFAVNMSGAADFATVAAKDFVTLGIITVRATEVHSSGPLGLNRRVEGSKITFADLMQEAARLEADDIINVRIDVHSSFRRSAFDWFTGWTRTFNYTATALAIRYTYAAETADPQLNELPRMPESTRAVRTRGTRVELR